MVLFQIAPDDVDQLLRCLGLIRFGIEIRIHDVEADVVLENLRHQPVDRAATGRQLLEDLGAVAFGVEQLFDAVELARECGGRGSEASPARGRCGASRFLDKGRC